MWEVENFDGDCRFRAGDEQTGSNAGPVVGSLRFLGFVSKRSSITSLRLLVSRKLDSQSFAQVDEGCLARNSLLKPFSSLPNALSFSNSLRKLRLVLRRMPAHSLLFDQSNVANSKHTVSRCLREDRIYNSGAKNRSCTQLHPK